MLSHHKGGADRTGFREFSEALWASPQLRGACLDLQDSAGIDVNLVLLALFLAAHGRAADADVAARAGAASQDWTRPVTDNLRAARRAIKGQDDALYEKALSLELEAEAVLQDRLAAIAEGAPAAPADTGLAAANLAALIGAAVASDAARALLAAWRRFTEAGGPVGSGPARGL